MGWLDRKAARKNAELMERCQLVASWAHIRGVQTMGFDPGSEREDDIEAGARELIEQFRPSPEVLQGALGALVGSGKMGFGGAILRRASEIMAA